jgi:hypothetical protein
MSHLRLVAPPAPTAGETTDETTAGSPVVPAQRQPWDDPKVATLLFQAATGICLCRACTKERHPAYGTR